MVPPPFVRQHEGILAWQPLPAVARLIIHLV
jgi:hypothetical protein